MVELFPFFISEAYMNTHSEIPDQKSTNNLILMLPMFSPDHKLLSREKKYPHHQICLNYQQVYTQTQKK